TTSRQMSPHVVMNETTLGRGVVDGFAPGELERREAANERGCGQALVGRLLKACLDRDIEPLTGHRAVELILDDHRVVGVVFETDAGGREVRADKGVVLATGGFEHNRDLVRSFIRGPLTRTVAVDTNTGDGLKMAMRVGAALGNMQEAWWVPCIDVPDDDGEVFPWMVNRERVRPRCIMVNRAGVRFANEASNYNAFGAAFHQLDAGSFEYSNLPAYMVFDHEYAVRWGVYNYHGEGVVPTWLVSGETLEELAIQIDVNPSGLADTVGRWNAISEDLDDPDFGRGRSVNDIHWGDSRSRGPDATLGPIDTPPYYAVEVHPGALGTKGGPRTTVDAQVVDLDGTPIEGLYAAGNVMASAMGMTYGGAGGTLGPGMVFGFLAGRDVARA
ncbi:MAG: FAD-binding protein, partial [Acidimicrobiales bacterium]